MAKLYYEDVDVGCDVPTLTKNPTTIQLVKWAGATQDPARIHYDRDRAQMAKLPGLIVHGLLKCQWLTQMMTSWIGDDGELKRISCQYRGMDLVTDTITCRGRVTRKYSTDDGGFIECELWLGNQRDEETTLGRAIAVLPSRD